MLLTSFGKPISIAFTGGIDSTTLLYWLAEKMEPKPPTIRLLMCNYGQANWDVTFRNTVWHATEIRARYGISTHWAEIPIRYPSWEGTRTLMEEGYVPPVEEKVSDWSKRPYEYALIDGRNAIMSLYMASYASAHYIPTVYVGTQYEDLEWENLDSFRVRVEDSNSAFYERINLLLEQGYRRSVRFEAPWMLLRMNKTRIIQEALRLGVNLEKTYSCYFHPVCGKCDNCVCRARALAEAGVKLSGEKS